MSGYNNNDSSDPTFDKSGNAAVGEFYSSGGKNDSTGREPFEDSTSRAAGFGSSGLSGSGGRGLGGETSDGQYGSSGTGAGAYGSSGLNQRGGDENYRGTDSARDTYGSNTAANDYSSSTAGVGAGGLGSDSSDSYNRSGAGGLGGRSSDTSDSYNRTGGAGYGGQTGDDYGSSGNTGDNYGDARQTGDNIGTDRSDGFGRDGGAGNMGVSGYQGSDSRGVASGGAAGTDRFDVDRNSSGARDNFDDSYGNPSGDKYGSGQTNSGSGVSGGFSDNLNQSATGVGAYNNPHAKTGLTGREGAGSENPGDNYRGDNDTGPRDANSGGLIGKVKQAFSKQ